MIDRRFLDVRITVNGFAESVISNATYGDQYIVSKAWGDSYPNAVVNSIAKLGPKGWKFTMPSVYVNPLEVVNLATNEILKFDGSSNTWKAIGTLGGMIVPFVVDKAYSDTAPANTLDKVGEVYIVYGLNGDTNVYQIIGEGDKGRKSLGAVGFGQKVVVIENGYIYTVKSKTVDEAEVNYFNNDGYVPVNSLILSQRTQNVYLSAPSSNYKLASLTPQMNTAGENQGTLTIIPHTFTAEEVANKKVVFNDIVEEKNYNRVICFIGGNVCVANIDFGVGRLNTNDYRPIVYGSNSDYSWYHNFPAAGEVGIFMYFKK